MELNMRASLWFMLFLPSVVVADVPNTFQAGEAIKASEMNENFTDLQYQVDLVKSDIESNRLQIDVNSEMNERINILESALLALQNNNPTRVFVGLTVEEVVAGNADFTYEEQVYLGVRAMHKRCDFDYPGSRMCTWDEIEFSDAESTQTINQRSWIQDTERNCSGYTNTGAGSYGGNYYTNVVDLTSRDYRTVDGCAQSNPIACCK